MQRTAARPRPRTSARVSLLAMVARLACVLGVLAFASPARAGDAQEGEQKDAALAPQTMHVGIQLERLNRFEVGPGTFSAEFFLSFRCDHEPCRPDFELTPKARIQAVSRSTGSRTFP